MINKKIVNILVFVKFYRREGKIFQHFIFKNNNKFLNEKYLIYYKLISKIKEHALVNLGHAFLSKREEEDRIVLEYKGTEKFSNFYFMLVGTAAPFSGCKFCRHKGKEEGFFFYCIFQNYKLMSKEIENCRFFKEKE